MEKHRYSLVIRPSHIDVFGHVNNAKYLEIFEEARWDLIESKGWGLKRILRESQGPVILEGKIRYKRELVKDDKCAVETWLAEERGKIFVLNQILFNESGEAACEFEAVGALFDLKARRIIEPTDDWRRALGASV